MSELKKNPDFKPALYTSILLLVTIFITATSHPDTIVKLAVGGGSILLLSISILLQIKGILKGQYKYITAFIFYVVSVFYIGYSNDVGYINVLNIFVGVGLFSLYNNYRFSTINSIMGFLAINISAYYYKDTFFSTMNESTLITMNVYYIILCLSLINSSKIGYMLRNSALMAAKEANEKSQRVEELLAQLEQSAKNISDISTGVKENIEDIDSTSEHITKSVEIFTSRLMNENENVNNATISVDKIDSNIEDVIKISNDMIITSNETKLVIDDGIDKIKVLFDNMDNVKTVVTSTKDLMDDLKNQMNNVHSIVKTIEAISEQTNMLSLNAAIESARAGEQGKGFAVVSNSIRSLAAESKEATLDISNIIINLYKTINSVVDKVSEGEISVKEAEDTKKIVEEMLVDIQSTITKTTSKTKIVQSKIEDLNNISKSIKTNIHEISDSADDNAALIQDIMAKIQEENAAITNVTKDIQTLDELTEALHA